MALNMEEKRREKKTTKYKTIYANKRTFAYEFICTSMCGGKKKSKERSAKRAREREKEGESKGRRLRERKKLFESNNKKEIAEKETNRLKCFKWIEHRTKRTEHSDKTRRLSRRANRKEWKKEKQI